MKIVSRILSGDDSQISFTFVSQEDPISPYLFILVVEGLSCFLKHVMSNNEMEGIQVANTTPKINHIFFADDCILFSKFPSADATKVKEILEVYCNASR
jgi:hypothetical protein